MLITIYIFLIAYWIYERRNGLTGRNRYLLVTSILIFLLMGLRNMAIYGDTIGYVINFKSMESKSIGEVALRWIKDPVFYLSTKIFGDIVQYDYTCWFLAIAAVYMIPMYFFLKKYSPNIMFSWITFIFLGLLLFTMAGLRQTVALGLTLWAFMYLMKRKDLYFFVLLFISYLMHGPSVIFILIYPFVRWRPKFTKISVYLYITFIIFGIAFGTVLLPKITAFLGEQDYRYIEYGENLTGSTYTYMIQQLLLVIPSLYVLRNRWHEETVGLFAHLSMLSLAFVSMSPVIAEMFRVSMYFSWSILILFPMAMHEIRKQQPFVPLFAILCMTVYLVFINKTLLMPYYFWFEDTEYYINRTFLYLDELG